MQIKFETTNNNDFLCLQLDSHHGVFIPQFFLQQLKPEYREQIQRAYPDSYETVMAGPESDFYWDCWDHLEQALEFVDQHNRTWRLHQDGDLWSYCVDKIDSPELKEFFGDC